MRISFLIVATLAVLTCQAESNGNVPFVEEGKVWRMLYHNPGAPDLYPDFKFSYFIDGDTIISNKKCKKLYGFNEQNNGLTQYKMALYEDEAVVYFIPQYSENQYVLYDFSDSFQETAMISSPEHPENVIKMKLYERKTANINGTDRICLHVNRQWDDPDEDLWNWPAGWWVQGIGSTLGPLYTWGFSNSGIYGGLIECELNGEIIFTTKNFKEKYCDALFIEDNCQNTAFNLFSSLMNIKDDTDNICFSPLSVQLALSMVQNGADGNTLHEMKRAMGVSGYSDGEINAFNQVLTQSLTTRPEFIAAQWKWYGDTEEEARKYYDAEYPVCEIANSVWHRPDITLFDSFTDTARSYYDAGIGSVRFDTQEGIDQINQWVSDKTHTLIPKIYNEPQSAELAVVLANALYFKGAWHTPFDKENTRPGVFHNANGSNVMTDMMTVRAEYQSASTDKFQSLTLPYGNGDFSMTIFMPAQGTSLPDLTRGDWDATVGQQQKSHPYALSIPKFKFDGRHELNDILKKMGMKEAFDMEADFSRMSNCRLFVDSIFQLSDISVDEQGTEASAVTVIEMRKNAETDTQDFKPFTVERPFYFTIENRKEKAVLFVGRVATLEGEPFTSKPADVNQDNTVDISDIVAVINVIAGTDSNDKADVNADGKTDISDIVAIINSIAK